MSTSKSNGSAWWIWGDESLNIWKADQPWVNTWKMDTHPRFSIFHCIVTYPVITRTVNQLPTLRKLWYNIHTGNAKCSKPKYYTCVSLPRNFMPPMGRKFCIRRFDQTSMDVINNAGALPPASQFLCLGSCWFTIQGDSLPNFLSWRIHAPILRSISQQWNLCKRIRVNWKRMWVVPEIVTLCMAIIFHGLTILQVIIIFHSLAWQKTRLLSTLILNRPSWLLTSDI